MKYELINPSDLILYDAPDVLHSAVATSLMSTAYGGTCLEEGGEDSPMFLFGGAVEFIEEKSGMSISEFLEKNAQSMYDTMMSFRYETERTSMSKIVDAAHTYGRAIQKKFLAGGDKNEN